MRYDIINKFIKDRGYTSYLEIGVDQGQTWNKVSCADKVGVDPSPNTKKRLPEIQQMTSDQFFRVNQKTFDIVFIDGLHHASQVYRDIINSLEVINEGGVIVCHDMLPYKEEIQRVPRETREWTGDCWKAWAFLRASNPDISMYIYDTDYGVGVIEKGEQELIDYADLNWEWFVKNKDKLNIRKYETD